MWNDTYKFWPSWSQLAIVLNNLGIRTPYYKTWTTQNIYQHMNKMGLRREDFITGLGLGLGDRRVGVVIDEEVVGGGREGGGRRVALFRDDSVGGEGRARRVNDIVPLEVGEDGEVVLGESVGCEAVEELLLGGGAPKGEGAMVTGDSGAAADRDRGPSVRYEDGRAVAIRRWASPSETGDRSGVIEIELREEDVKGVTCRHCEVDVRGQHQFDCPIGAAIGAGAKVVTENGMSGIWGEWVNKVEWSVDDERE